MKSKADIGRVAIILLLVSWLSPGIAADKNIEVRIGWQPLGGAPAIVYALMAEDKLFTKHAKRFGYEVKESWKPFYAGPPLNEAIAGGQIDIDLDRSTIPVVSAILAGVTQIPIAVSGSPLHNGVLVAPNSSIKDVTDLPGRTVGLVVGSASHYLLASIIFQHFGKAPDAIGIKFANMPPSEAVKMPRGLDLAVAWPPHRYIGPQEGRSELLVDGSGLTGKAHRTPGIKLPEVKKSWAAPEGYNLDRIYVGVRESFLREQPDLALAFLQARAEAFADFVKDPRRGIELATREWKQPELIVKQTIAQYAETTGIRPVQYLLEADVLAMVKTSEFLRFIKVRDRVLTFDELKLLLLKGAEIQRRSWEMGGSKPSSAELVKGFSGRSELYGELDVKGGAPIWEWARTSDWAKRMYRPGPFPGE